MGHRSTWRRVRVWSVGLLLLAACGCARSPAHSRFELSPERWERLLQQRELAAGAVEYPLAITPAMRSAAREMAGPGGAVEQLRSLQSALFDPDRFPFDYSSRESYTAREAFESRRGNCVSFTNLFVALARSLGHPVSAALVVERQRSERAERLVVVNTHIVAVIPQGSGVLVFDFDRSRREPAHPLRLIDDLWITAILANNRGVERLRAGDTDGALERIELATRLAPGFVEALGNLGVALRRAGRSEHALDAYRRALEIDPGHPGVLLNLSALLRELGRTTEADEALAAARVRDASPHGLIVLGNLERDRGRPGRALELYRRARRMDRTSPEPWIAVARLRLSSNEPARARRALRKALRLDPEHSIAAGMLRAVDGR